MAALFGRTPGSRQRCSEWLRARIRAAYGDMEVDQGMGDDEGTDGGGGRTRGQAVVRAEDGDVGGMDPAGSGGVEALVWARLQAWREGGGSGDLAGALLGSGG